MAKYFPPHNIVNIQSNKQSLIKTRPSSTPTVTSSPIPKVVSLLGAAPQHEHILKQGWILQKSKRLKQYHRRFMQLKGDKLLCYKSDKFRETDKSPTETFDLSFHRYRLDKHNKVKVKFYLIDETILNSRTFKAYTEVDRDDWVYQIRNSIVSGKTLRQSSVANIHKYYGGNENEDIFATFESEMCSENMRQMHDSESEESETEFGLFAMKKNVCRKRSISRRKTNFSITCASFDNFRIGSLTVDTMQLNVDMDCDDSLDLTTLLEEKEQFNDADFANIDEMLRDIGPLTISPRPRSDCVLYDADMTNFDIIAQLKIFGYEEDAVIAVMTTVINPNDINELKEKLDEEVNANFDLVMAAELNNNINIVDKLGMSQSLIVNPGVYDQSSTDSQADSMDSDDFKTVHCELRDLEKKERAIKRGFIEQEIISTEERYYQGLDTLLNGLIQPMFDNGYVDKKYYAQIRSSLPQILQFHAEFWHELNVVYEAQNSKTLASVFNQCIMDNKEKFIDIYIEFIKDYDSILDLFGSTFHGNLELAAFLKAKRRERKPLSGFLILPVQRVPRYILLLTDLLRHTEQASDDYADINAAVEMINDITQEINERKRKIENLSQCLHIQQELNGLKQPIIDNDRMFIQQFIFIKKEIKHQRLFFLFDDIVIVANEKWKVKMILDVRRLDVEVKINHSIAKKKRLPEFELVSGGCGGVVYIGEDIETINRFKRLVSKYKKMVNLRGTRLLFEY